MKYAQVAVNAPTPRIYSFALTTDLPPGSGVWVPWGKETAQGIILKLTDSPGEESWGEIFGPIKPIPLLFPHQIELARWLSSYYLTPIFRCLSLMLPPGWEQELISYLEASQLVVDSQSPEEEKLLKWLKKRGKIRLEEAEKGFGKKKLKLLLPQLTKKGLIVQTRELEKLKITTKKERCAHLNIPSSEIPSHYQDKLKMLSQDHLVPVKQLSASGVSSSTIYYLKRRGILTIREREILPEREELPSPPLPPLTPEQSLVFKQVSREIETGKGKLFLLMGANRKEIYLHLLSHTLSLGKGAFCLFPQLSGQLAEYFRAYFPGRVALLHSKLTLRKQYDAWLRIRYGIYDIVLGSRSALFAPLPKPGLIILDDEQDESFKEENPPTYHSRQVAFKLAELCGAVVLLGSETPDVSTYHKATEGEITLLELPPKIPPEIEVIDLRQELKGGNQGFISHKLEQSLKETLKGGERAILFLNRKGAYPLVRCLNCRFILLCRACTIPLNYHSLEDKLICHHCNYRASLPSNCPRCGTQSLSLFGLGIERIFEELKASYPEEKILLYDKESASYQAIEEFRKPPAGIALGTQLIAREEFPQASLVGIIFADANLNLPDFRIGEKVFRTLWQVIGKAQCRVVLQSYFPEHPVLKAISQLSYLAFYEQEIEHRRRLGLPPLSWVTRLIYKHPNARRCRQEAEELGKKLILESQRQGLQVKVSGPSPAFLSRLKGHYRWQIVLIGEEINKLLNSVVIPKGWLVDVDAENFL